RPRKRMKFKMRLRKKRKRKLIARKRPRTARWFMVPSQVNQSIILFISVDFIS
ncbi:hypothetical protein CAPTEDRAFT_103002, partial [Capitella teleta]